MSLEVTVFTVMGTSKVDRATKLRIYAGPINVGVNRISSGIESDPCTT